MIRAVGCSILFALASVGNAAHSAAAPSLAGPWSREAEAGGDAPVVWDALPDLPRGAGLRGALVSTLDGGRLGPRIVVAGGATADGAESSRTWLFDGEGWSPGPRLPGSRAHGAAVQVGGSAWWIGGRDAGEVTSEVWIATLDGGGELVVGDGPALPEPSGEVSGAVVDSHVVVLGSRRAGGGDGRVRTTWVLDLEEKPWRWQTKSPFPGAADLGVVTAAQMTSCGEPALFAYSGEVVAAAGGRTASRELWRYRVGEDRWDRLASSPGDLAWTASCAWPTGQSQILFFSDTAGTVALYDATVDAWRVWSSDDPSSVVAGGSVTRWDGGLALVGGAVEPGAGPRRVSLGRVEPSSIPLAPSAYWVMGLYLLAIVGVGIYAAGTDRTDEDFFLAGRRIPWWAAGLSIYATQLSAITYVAIPAKAFSEDWVFALGSVSLILMAPIVAVFYLPFYRRLGIQTAYEYLELRFGLSVRLFGSASFILFQIARMAIVVFLPSLALATVTGVSIYACILAIGILATAYTVIGGFAAVVWTDVVQVFVLLGGVALAMVLAVRGAGGFEEALGTVLEYEKLRVVAPGFSWTDSATWSVLLGGLFLQLGPYTSDQAVVQRYLSTRDEKAAARAVWLNAWVAVPMTFVFFAVGSALFAYFHSAPERLTPGRHGDEVFPLFIALELPPLMSGLVLAGIFAASMSSLDSSMHAIATAWTNDWHDRLGIGGASRLVTGRRVTLLMGVIGTGVATLMAAADLVSLYDVFQRVLGLLVSPLAGLFILGIFTDRTTTLGAWAGALASIGVLAFVQHKTPLNFMLYGAVGTMTAVVVGYLVSLASRARARERGLTWWTLDRSP